MQRRTLTTLSELRKGDIFHYPKKEEEKFQVKEQGGSYTHINKPGHNGGFVSKYDDVVRNNKQVIFLRHTIPIQGERYYVQDIRLGDVFHTTNDIITEYKKVLNGVIIISTGLTAPQMKLLDEIVFIRNENN